MQVLLAENCGIFRLAFLRVLRRRRHKVEQALGFYHDMAGGFHYRTVEVERTALNLIGIALVDSWDRDDHLGTSIVRELTALGVPCIAIAAMEDRNQQLIDAGAVLSMQKGAALAAIYSGTLKLRDARAPVDGLQEQLKSYAREYRHDEALKTRLDKLVERCAR